MIFRERGPIDADPGAAKELSGYALSDKIAGRCSATFVLLRDYIDKATTDFPRALDYRQYCIVRRWPPQKAPAEAIQSTELPEDCPSANTALDERSPRQM